MFDGALVVVVCFEEFNDGVDEVEGGRDGVLDIGEEPEEQVRPHLGNVPRAVAGVDGVDLVDGVVGLEDVLDVFVGLRVQGDGVKLRRLVDN